VKTVDLWKQELPFELTRNVPNTLLSLFYPAVFIPIFLFSPQLNIELLL
jgi:hypothetical protein